MKNFNRISLFFLWLFFACNPDSNEPEPTLPVTENPTTPYVEEPTGFVPCENGFAGDYPCLGYDLFAHIGLSVFDSVEANDNWGWTDSLTGKEYVLVGLDNGTAFVDISSLKNLSIWENSQRLPTLVYGEISRFIMTMRIL